MRNIANVRRKGRRASASDRMPPIKPNGVESTRINTAMMAFATERSSLTIVLATRASIRGVDIAVPSAIRIALMMSKG